MRNVPRTVVLTQAGVLAVFGVALRSGAFPLGIKGEWEWLRFSVAPAWFDLLIAAGAVAAYAGFVALGLRSLSARASRRREVGWLLGLALAAVVVQAIVPCGAPDAYGLAKWAFALHDEGASGYFAVARKQVRDPGRFLSEYPEWVRHQDALHIGTHPPGLFLVAHVLLRAIESRPETARFVVAHVPGTVEGGFRSISAFEPMPIAYRATLALAGALTLLACALTVVPLYALARSCLPVAAAWSAAALWPLVPAAILFQPAADTAFPLLSTTAMALAVIAGRSSRGPGLALATGSGVALALGMACTLAFLPVGLVVGLVLATAPGSTGRQRLPLIAATSLGFLVPTLTVWALSSANPFVIWWWNQRNHARFYVEYRRTYLAWVIANPIELSVALGLPASIWAALGFGSARRTPRAAWATLAVLVALNLSGRNLSEVARLWLPLMPPLLTAAGLGLTRLGGGPLSLAATVALLGSETLVLQATIQVVYPV